MNATLTGFGALVGVLLDILKHFNLLPDDTAGKIAFVASAVLVGVEAAAGFVSLDLSSPNQTAQAIAELTILLFGTFGVSLITHKALRLAKISRPKTVG